VNEMEFLCVMRLENGQRWGDICTDVQRADAEAILDPFAPERFHLITRSRGYSKTTDLGAIAIAVLLTAPRLSRSYALAADQAQARLLLDSMEGFIRRHPQIGEMLEVQAWRIVQRRNGATIEALAADAAGSWGLRPYFVVCDEISQWGQSGAPKRIWEAITSAMPKTGGRLVAICTAGSPSHWSARVREHAAKSDLWRLSETPGPAPWIPEELLAEQRARLLPSSYSRLFLNEWTGAEDQLVSEDDLLACVTLDGPLPPQPNVGYVVACDYGAKHDRTVCVVMHGEQVTRTDHLGVEQVTGTRVVLDRMQVWQGTPQNAVPLSEVEEWIAQASRTFNNAQVRLDPWQMIGSLQRLREVHNIVVEEFFFGAQSVGKLAAVLHRLLRDHLLSLPNDPELLDELRSVRLEERTPGVVRLTHDSDRHDDRAVALGLAAHKIVDEGRIGPPARGHFIRDDRPAYMHPEGSIEAELTYEAAPMRLSREMRL
jgi:hypothetical protein